MPVVFQAQSVDGKLSLGSEFNTARLKQWLKDNPGKRLKITPDEKISYNFRKFFEGAVVPFFAYQHFIKGKRMSIKSARNTLKREFNPIYITRLDGTREIVGGSTKEMNSEQFKAYVDTILRWMEEQGHQIPDPEDYKKWRDSSPLIGEIYPPLKRLIELPYGI